MKPTIHQLRAFAISHSLFRPTTLPAAFDRLGFVQADPIRAPARAHDLILRQRVKGYRAGDLERHYGSLELEEVKENDETLLQLHQICAVSIS